MSDALSDIARGHYYRGEPEKELREEDKPGCFGAIGKIGKRKDPECPCAWKDRCRQSQEDY
jgi:hypothetical protein